MFASLTRTRSLAVSIALFAGAAGAMAQGPGGPPPGGPLGGPRVRDHGVPGESQRFGEGKPIGKDARGERPIPHRVFIHAFDALRGEDAGSLALTPDQDARLREIHDGARREFQAYVDQHRDAVREALKDLPPGPERRRAMAFANQLRDAGIEPGARRAKGPAGPDAPPGAEGPARGRRRADRGEGGPPRPGQPPMDVRPMEGRMDGPDGPPVGEPIDERKAEAARHRLREIMEGAPKITDAHARAFAVLTAAQRPVVERELARLRDEAEQRRQAWMDDRRDQMAPDEPKDGLAKDRVRERVRGALKDLPPEERERLKAMSPEERREHLRKRAGAKP